MKTLSNLLIGLFCLSYAMSASCQYNTDISFNTPFSNSYIQSMGSKQMVELPGNELLVVGTVLECQTCSNHDIIVQRLDASGAVLWSSRIGVAGIDERSNSAIITDDQNHLLISGSWFDGSSVDALALKFDFNTQSLLWSFHYTNPFQSLFFEEITCAASLDGNSDEYMLIGKSANLMTANGFDKLLVVRINGNGVLLRKWRYTEPVSFGTDRSINAQSVVRNNNGNFTIAGEYIIPIGGTNLNKDLFIFEVSSSGNPMSNFNYYDFSLDPNFTAQETTIDLIQNSAGNYFASFTISSGNPWGLFNISTFIGVAEFSSNYMPLSQNCYWHDDKVENIPVGIYEHPSQSEYSIGLLLFDNNIPNMQFHTMGFMKVDLGGAFVDSRFYSGTDSKEAMGIIEGDVGYYLSGLRNWSSSQGSSVIATDFDGLTNCMQQEPFNESPLDVNVTQLPDMAITKRLKAYVHTPNVNTINGNYTQCTGGNGSFKKQAVGLTDLPFKSHIYPSVVKTGQNISITTESLPSGGIELEVYDRLGKLVEKKEWLHSVGRQIELSSGNWANTGLYWIRISDKTGKLLSTHKFLII